MKLSERMDALRATAFDSTTIGNKAWDELTSEIRKLEAMSLAVCEYFEADYHIPVEVKKLMEILNADNSL